MKLFFRFNGAEIFGFGLNTECIEGFKINVFLDLMHCEWKEWMKEWNKYRKSKIVS
ncbi:MAG TPA: hypothetical protein VGQ59_07195 [Cyclobacteriaceae bacterium]|nr:hypothetical protein [Cyclobacteriaceae bacterium]